MPCDYDGVARTLTSEAGLQGATSMQYDLAGRRTRLTYPGTGLAIDYDYLFTGEVSRIRENGATSGPDVLATYAYDNLGRRTSLARGNGTTTGYGYDHASRLTQIVQDLTGTANDLILDFTHNPAGQIATNTRSNDAFAWTGHYAVNRPYTANGLNQYTAAGGITPSYDARGNFIAAGGASFAYNARNQLWWAYSAAPGTAFYYDPLGRMSAIIADNWATITHLLHDGGNLIAERDNASGNILRRYVHGPGTDEPLVWYEGAGTSDRRWLHADERGSVIAISNASGTVTNINTYDESGIPAATNVGRFQYTGQQWIAEMGMYYYRARIYSPTLGRFMQTDPIGYNAGMNMYAYVGNDPVNSTDPSGLTDTDHPFPSCTGWDFCGNSGSSFGGSVGGAFDQMITVTGRRQCQSLFCISFRPDIFFLQDFRRLSLWDFADNQEGLSAAAQSLDACGGRITANPVARMQLAVPAAGTAQGSPSFGSRRGGHWGIDFANPAGASVFAAGSGRVVRADGRDADGFGGQIVIGHGGQVYTQYGHLGTFGVGVADNVIAGATIGTTAMPGGPGSGNLTAGMSPHLHFEVRLGGPEAHSMGGNPIDPNRCLPGS